MAIIIVNKEKVGIHQFILLALYLCGLDGACLREKGWSTVCSSVIGGEMVLLFSLTNHSML